MSASRIPTGGATPPGAASWWPLVAACLGTLLLLTHTTIITVALPDIAADLGAGFGATQWIVDVFTVVLAGTVLGMGSLSDVLGRRRVYLAGLTAFTLATLGCGLAPTAGLLITGRAVQGLAGAAMFATILPLVGQTYRGRARARAFAAWGTTAGVAGAAGTLAGGVVTQLLGWRWIFFSSLPLAAAALVLAVVSLPDVPRPGRRLDLAGILTATTAVSAVTYGVIEIGDRGTVDTPALLGGTVAVLAAAGFGAAQRFGPDPLLPPRLFATRAFLGVAVTSFGYYLAAFGALPVVSGWLRHGAGLTPVATATLLAGQVVIFFMVSSLLSARLHDAPPGRTLGGATVLVGLGCVSGATLLIAPSWFGLLPALLLTGAGAGLVSPLLPAVAMASVPDSYGGTAGAASNSARQFGLALGIALSATIAAGGPATGPGAVAALVSVFLTLGTIALLAAVVAAACLPLTARVPSR